MTPHPCVDFSVLRQQVDEYRRRMIVPAIILLTLFVISFAGFITAIWYFDLPSEPPGELIWKRSAVISGFMLSVFASLGLFCGLAPSAPAVVCPHCKKAAGPGVSMLILATGCCPNCFRPLFHAADSLQSAVDAPPAGLLTRAEFQARRAGLKMPLPLFTVAVSLLAIGLMVGLIQHGKTIGLFRLNENQALVWETAILVSGGALLIGYLAFWSRRRRQELAKCSCPSCGNPISEGPAPLMTGHCTECGGQVFADPPPRLPRPICQTPLTIQELKTRGRIWHQWGWLCCLVGTLPALLFAVAAWFQAKLSRSYEPWWFIGLAVMTILLQLGGIACCQWRLRRFSAIHCPECHRHLTDFTHLIIASRNCPFCGATILPAAQDAMAESPDLSSSPSIR